MTLEIIMPKVDMDQETGTVLEWLIAEGEQVERGEPLLIIETEKVSMEIESPGSGILSGVRAQEGEIIPVGEVIAYLLAPGESLPSDAQPSPRRKADLNLGRETDTTRAPAPKATPLARRVATHAGIDLADVPGSGKQGMITRLDVETHGGLTGSPGLVRATPAARRRARLAGLSLGSIQGSGPRGRVQQADVDSEIRIRQQPAGRMEAGAIQRIPLRGMRRTIAERLTASYQQIPHISFTTRVDLTQFSEARRGLNARAEDLGNAKVSATAIFVKAVGLILRDYPYLNASLQDDQILIQPQIHIGVAVALADGLIVPVVRDADGKGIRQIAMEIDDLKSRAQQGRLTPEDVSGGTFTISNLGPFGIEQFTAIINPPQSGVLAIGAATKEFVPDVDDRPVVRQLVRMTLSVDHRIVDGAVAAHFMADLKAAIENPFLLLGY